MVEGAKVGEVRGYDFVNVERDNGTIDSGAGSLKEATDYDSGRRVYKEQEGGSEGDGIGDKEAVSKSEEKCTDGKSVEAVGLM